MILSDSRLLHLWPGSDPGPASLDVHLGDTLIVWPREIRRDPRIDQSHIWRPVSLKSEVWVMRPGLRYLATTHERVKVPDDLVGRIEGRSSWGRDGLEIHRTAGYLDPGFLGNITLELSVVGSELVVWPGARIGQLVLHMVEGRVLKPYCGKYQDQDGPQPSRLHLDPDVRARWGVAS